MSSPFFSIIIPTYNRAGLILRSVNSVLKQSFSDYELIIIDDGSTDNTEQLILSLNNLRIKYFKTENGGVARARNEGIKNAVGKYVTFLDSDDMVELSHLETAYNLISKNNYPGVVHLNFMWGTIERLVTHKNTLPDKLPDDLFKNCSLHVNCIFIRNEIAKASLFNESRLLMFAEDWDFFIKLAVRQNILLSDQVTSYLVDHENRNMRNFDEPVWIAKKNALIDSLRGDPVVSKSYNNKIKLVEAHMSSLISVNLAARNEKRKSISYLFKSVFSNPGELFTRRFLAIMKHLFLTWKS
jgi:glycosyltransferase involved in cell wall biosynthesis